MATVSLIDDLQRSLAATETRQLAVAFSGGLDSSVLLHLLSRCRRARELGLRALHVDHGLHPDASRWAEHCVEFAGSLALPIRVLRVAVERNGGLGLEAAAREARYGALTGALEQGEWLATAQHQDDQAETLLLRLLRGSGSRGLAAMRATRPLGHAVLWRPLLGWPRAELQRYADEHQLIWIEDPANADPRHDRSWLRQEILPRIRQRWPAASDAIAASAALLADEADRLDDASAGTLAELIDNDRSLPLDALRAMGAAERASTLRLWLRQWGADPLPRHLHAVLDRDLLGAAEDASPILRWGNYRLRRYRNILSLAPAAETLSAIRSDAAGTTPLVAWDGSSSLDGALGGRLRIEPQWTGPALMVGLRCGGERMRLPGRQHSHSLKKLLQSLGVPPWERQRLPLIWSTQGELLAVGDRLISETMQQWLTASKARLVWTPGTD